MAASMLSHLRRALVKLESSIAELINFPKGHGLHPALATVTTVTRNDTCSQGHKTETSVLDSIFGSGILWAVPKSRRSLERRMTRRMQYFKHYEHATPKKNIIACLECGHWHQRHTICGNCYAKVKEETEAMQESMSVDDRLYNAPQQEVVYLYEGEEDQREKYKGQYIVEIPKKRPQWWPQHMLTKSRT